MSRLSFFEKFILPLTIFVSIVTTLSALAPYINPQKTWVIAFLGLGFPFIYVVNFFFLVLWIIKRRKLFVLPLLPFLIGLKILPAIIQINLSDHASQMDSSKTIKVMSFNVRSFDLYNWLGNWTGKSKTKDQIFELIKKESPDVICFQEFYTCDSGKFQTVKIMMQDIRMYYSQVVLPVTFNKIDHWGMAIFSKYPLLQKEVIDFNHRGSNLCLLSDMVVNEDTIRIYNCHLQSIRFGQEDYKFMNQIGYNLEQENATGVKKIISRLKVAFTKRASQADTVASSICSSKYPVILCGDFNDTPSSYSYSTIGENLCDAFRESGNGLSTTYVGAFPAFRIDFIFHSPQLKSFEYRIIPQKLSDHYPVTCVVNLH